MKGRHEIAVGSGLLSGREIAIRVGLEEASTVSSVSPTYYISYRYFVGRRFAIGVTAGIQAIKGVSNQDNQSGSVYSFSDKCTTVAFEMTNMYMQRKIASWYTRFGVGISFISEVQDYGINGGITKKFNLLNFQYTPFGVRIGKSIAGFLELGIGYKGLVQTGLSLALQNKKTTKSTTLP